MYPNTAITHRQPLRLLLASLLLGALWGCASTPPPVVQYTEEPVPVAVVFEDTGTPAAPVVASLLAKGRHPALRHADFNRYRDILRNTYASHGNAPRWVRDGRLTTAGEQVLTLISEAAADGLAPRDYDIDWLNRQARQLDKNSRNGNALAHFDIGLSIAFARLIHDVHAGRVTPREAGINLDTSLREASANTLVKRAFGNEAPEKVFAAARPRFALYHRLRESLTTYRELAAHRTQPRLPAISASIKPGQRWPGVPALADWLTYLGDYAGMEPADDTYSPALASAVKHFQLRHGLSDDGVIGKGTWNALVTPLPHRVHQIELAMERMRWLSEQMANQRAIVVNIPQFVLWAFPGKSSASGLNMDVVVGNAVKSNTPVLLDEVERVVFHPYWNVPSSITQKELLPKLRKDPTYLVNENMELVGQGQVLADVPTPELLDAVARGEYRIRQRPGPWNALGRIKFEFPNRDAIYMHDTPSKGGFYASRRDFSHGCIRLSHPQRMANFLLNGQNGWTEQRIAEAVASNEPQVVELREHVPVLLFYTTSLVDSEGKAVFLEDIYDYDRKLEQALLAADQRKRR